MQLRYEASPVDRGTRYVLMKDDESLSYLEAIDLMAKHQAFRKGLTAVLAESPYTAYRWETPPVTCATIGRPFEFVLMDAPHLAPTPEPEVFSSFFAAAPADVDVLAVPNLTHTATLIIPRQLVEPRSYTHLARFVREAPKAQVHRLWQCVAMNVKANVSQRPLWLSTAGGGVSWLHVRIEGVPKYYTYGPYADDA